MFAILVVVAALIRFNVVHCRASNEDQFVSEHVAKIFSEDDMTPDFTEQLGRHDHTTDIKKRNDAGNEKYGPTQNEASSTTKPVVQITVKNSTARNVSEPTALGHNVPERNVPGRKAPGRNASGRNALGREGEKRHIMREDMDVVDREDHVTQYLAEQLVNTDSEITSLQASENEDEQTDSVEVKEDSFFAFLTGQERPLEVDGAWSRPVDDQLALRSVLKEDNVITDLEYKDFK